MQECEDFPFGFQVVRDFCGVREVQEVRGEVRLLVVLDQIRLELFLAEEMSRQSFIVLQENIERFQANA